MVDTLSRAPESGQSVQDCLEQEAEAYVDATFSSIPATERRMEEIRQHQEEEGNSRCIVRQDGHQPSQELSNPTVASRLS